MKKNFFTKTILLIAVILLVIGVTAALTYKKTVDKTTKNVSVSKTSKKELVDHPKVEILMKDGRLMMLELYPEYAPETVANFIKLAKAGFYDGLKFHRIVKGFMVQGGDPKGDGTGGADKTIKGEFTDNSFSQNTLKHVKGIISMARSNDMDSASSQFFIMDGTQPYLDGKYAAFGKLVSGDKTLDSIANTPVINNPATNEVSMPTKDVIIKKIIVLAQVKK